MWNKLKNAFESVTRSMVSGPDTEQSQSSDVSHTPAPKKTKADDTPRQQPHQSKSSLDNTIDHRDQAVKLIVESMRHATGTNLPALANLVVWVVVDREDFNPLDYSWADQKMIDNLRLTLDNTMLEAIGRESIRLKYVVRTQLPKAVEVVKDQLYYNWSATKARKPDARVRAEISAVDGTGSLKKECYLIDSDVKKRYHIGRGVKSTGSASYRINDIVIDTDNPDSDIQQMNNCVSSTHADIVARDGQLYLQACRGGCRNSGGSPTKLIRDEKAVELDSIDLLYPLSDGDMVELGKSVLLTIHII